jgi:hypothetical protein
MVTLAFGTLSSRVRQNYGLIRAAAERGVTRDAINDLIKATGQRGIRTKEIQKGMTFARTGQQQANTMRFVRKDRKPNYSEFRKFAPVKSLNQYLVEYKVEWRNNITGELGESFLTMGELDALAEEGWDLGHAEDRYGVGVTVLRDSEGRRRITSGVPRQRE